MAWSPTSWLDLATTRMVAMKKQATDKGGVDPKDDDRSRLFAWIVLALAIASMMVLTVASLTLVAYGVSALFKWLAG
jgi:hypothetical protein